MARRLLNLDGLDELHGRYEEDPWGLHWRGTERLRHEYVIKVLKRFLVKKPSEKLHALDVGCSHGDFSAQLRNIVSKVTAVDVSPTAVERAAYRHKHPGLEFLAETVPGSDLPRSSYDLIACLEMLYYLEKDDQKIFMEEVVQLLRPDGLVVVASLVGDEPYFQPEEITSLVSRSMKVENGFPYGWSAYQRAEQSLFRIYWKLQLAHGYAKSSKSMAKKELSHDKEKISKIGLMFKHLGHIIVVGSLLSVCLAFSSRMIKIVLSQRWPARYAHRFARAFNLAPSHFMVVATKA